MTTKIAIQGELGSACDMAVPLLWTENDDRFDLVYSPTAQGAVKAIQSFAVDFAVFALESPVGVAVAETADALVEIPDFQVAAFCCLPVDHVVLTRLPIPRSQVIRVLSHSIPLNKHADYIRNYYPNANLEPVEDTGTAARKLSEGYYGDLAAVIALPSVAKLFGLTIACPMLPGNVGYMTKFVLIRANRSKQGREKQGTLQKNNFG
jgi:prephenate dehydratase